MIKKWWKFIVHRSLICTKTFFLQCNNMNKPIGIILIIRQSSGDDRRWFLPMKVIGWGLEVLVFEIITNRLANKIFLVGYYSLVTEVFNWFAVGKWIQRTVGEISSNLVNVYLRIIDLVIKALFIVADTNPRQSKREGRV